MKQRIASALLGVPLVLGVIWAGEPWFSILVALLALLGLREFYNLARKRGLSPLELLGSLWAILLLFNAHPGRPYERDLAQPFLAGGVLLSLVWLLLSRRGEKAMLEWAWTVAGVLYLGWMLSYFILLRNGVEGRSWFLLGLLAVFASDTASFFGGRAFGRRPLAPTISPGKTWEGAILGGLATLAAVFILVPLLSLELSTLKTLFLGLAIALAAPLGDLAESLLKRSAGVKDAGGLIPGHGGILDRLDSVVFSIVVLYYYVMWLA